MLQIISVNKEVLRSAVLGKDVLVAYIDEPFALTATFNFFNDFGHLDKEILNIMSKVNNVSSWVHYGKYICLMNLSEY